MKLLDALEVIKRPIAEGAPESKTFLSCGFTPLHLQTYLAAHLRILRPQHQVRVEVGLFGDLIGNIERLQPSGVHCLAVVVEWGDLDPRLGTRSLGGWRATDLSDIEISANRAAARLQRALIQASRLVPIVLCMPTLPLPPMFSTQPVQSGFGELQLHQTAAALAASLSQEPGIRVVNPQFLDGISPLAGRFDFKSEAITGFPYSLLHASLLGELLAGLIHNGQAKKGLITDLDDTLWGGILGEDGVNGISWHLEQRTHIHGIYQQFLASLASAGVLIGVASKNDAAVVEQAFDRRDLLISRNDIFPFEAHWSRKSESVDRIIKTWNIDPSAVVFVDDSPMEVAEVKAAFPELECIVFPKGDYQGIWGLLKHLRTAFGRPFLTEDDSLRMRSIRDSGAWREALESPAGSSDEFLRAVEACIVFHWGKQKEDGRAFELVNKTNQFNLNGRRFDESEWLGFFSDPDGFSLTVSYQDKYGSLGKVAVILGTSGECKLNVKCWVMSCRAFSRRIEYQCLRYLFEKLGSDEILFEYESTPRNGPVQDFLKELLGSPPNGRALLSRERFEMNVPALFHQVTEVTSA